MNKFFVRIKSLNYQLGLIERRHYSSRLTAKDTINQQGTQKVRLLDRNLKLSNSYIEVPKTDLLGLDGRYYACSNL